MTRDDCWTDPLLPPPTWTMFNQAKRPWIAPDNPLCISHPSARRCPIWSVRQVAFKAFFRLIFDFICIQTDTKFIFFLHVLIATDVIAYKCLPSATVRHILRIYSVFDIGPEASQRHQRAERGR